MKIVVPMAGHSRRFQQAGYDIPKPFLPIGDQTMIERVCGMFSSSDHFVFVVREDHLANPAYKKILEKAAAHRTIIPIAPHDKGPLFSSLAADPSMKADEPVIVTYCDFLVRWNYKQFLQKAAMADGAMAVFRGFHPASFGKTYYAYVRANENLDMLELREKQSFTEDRVSEYASTGIYYVDRWAAYKTYAEQVLRAEKPVASEYYCSLIYNPMVRDGKQVALYEVEKFICWGTPDDFREYSFWADYFDNDAARIGAVT